MTAEEAQRFRSGDEHVFNALFTTYSPRLLGAALRITPDRRQAHELVHDTWVQAFKNRKSFRGDGSILGWLLMILRNQQRATYRTETRHHARQEYYATSGAGLMDATADLDSRIDATRRRAQLLDALAELGERQRDVVVLRILEGCSVAQTAQSLGIAEGTVKATLAQALGRLRERMRKP